MSFIFNFFKLACLQFFSSLVFAASHSGFGGVATNLLDPISVFSDFVDSACLVIGGAFLFASLIKYIEHRRSPTMVTMSTVVFLLIAGILLLILPLTSYISEGGFHYSLFNKR